MSYKYMHKSAISWYYFRTPQTMEIMITYFLHSTVALNSHTQLHTSCQASHITHNNVLLHIKPGLAWLGISICNKMAGCGIWDEQCEHCKQEGIKTGRNKIVRGKAEHYFLPIYNARTIYPKYHSLPSCYKLIRQAQQLLLSNSNLKNNHCKRLITLSNHYPATIARVSKLLLPQLPFPSICC